MDEEYNVWINECCKLGIFGVWKVCIDGVSLKFDGFCLGNLVLSVDCFLGYVLFFVKIVWLFLFRCNGMNGVGF